MDRDRLLDALVRTGRRVAATVSVVAFFAATSEGAAPVQVSAQRNADACQITTSERVVAIGDVHGAHAKVVDLLRSLKLIDQRERWAGGRSILVQTGDVVDRGPDSRKTLDLLRRLEGEARRAGGQVWALIGNHEVMRMIGDWRYVSAAEYAAFRRADSSETRETVLAAALAQGEEAARVERRRFDAEAFRAQFLKDVPLGAIEMRQAFSAGGDYGRWLRSHVAMVMINSIAFVHGGVSPTAALLGCAGINAAVARDLAIVEPTTVQGAAMFSSQESGPLWYRGLVTEPAIADEDLTSILKTLSARALVVGHSVSPTLRIATHYGGRVVQIDTGMLGGEIYKGGRASALELTGSGSAAVYVDGREALPGPDALSP